jgi:phospholipase/lecithinase/hemolysin
MLPIPPSWNLLISFPFSPPCNVAGRRAWTRLATETGASIFDIFGLGTSITANPGAFGLSNVTDACGAPSNGCDPATAEFWDAIHPTAFAHSEIAEAFVGVATVPEASTWAMLIFGFAGIGLLAYRRKSQASSLAV